MKNIQTVMSVIIILCFVVIAVPCITVEASATAQKGTADALIEEAMRYQGLNLPQTIQKMKKNHNGKI